MKKNNLTLILFLLIGMLAGSIAAHTLADVKAIQFLTKSTPISWEPKADLDILKYDLKLQVKISLLSIIGLAGAFWIYRKL